MIVRIFRLIFLSKVNILTMGQIGTTSTHEESNLITIMLKSRNSTVAMKVDQFETMGTIASRYCKRDPMGLSSGLNLYYNGREIQGEETVNSLGITDGSVLIVRW